MPSVGGVFISVLGWEITDLFFHGPRTRSGGDNRMFPLRHVALVFTRASPVGGAARMFRIFPHLGLLLLVSDGFHRGGDEGCVPAHEELFRVLSRCFHVTFPCWGGLRVCLVFSRTLCFCTWSRMVSTWVVRRVQALVLFCVSSFLGASTFRGSGGLLSVPYESYPSGEG